MEVFKRIFLCVLLMICCIIISCSVNKESSSKGSLKEAAKKAKEKDPAQRVIKPETSTHHHKPNKDDEEEEDEIIEEEVKGPEVYKSNLIFFYGINNCTGSQFQSFDRFGIGAEARFENNSGMKILFSYNHYDIQKYNDLNQSLRSMEYLAMTMIGSKYLTDPINDLSLNVQAGIGLTYNRWIYKYPLIMEDTGREIKCDYLPGLEFSTGLRLGFFQNKKHSLGVILDTGCILFDDVTIENFDNDLFKTHLFLGLSFEYLFEL